MIQWYTGLPRSVRVVGIFILTVVCSFNDVSADETKAPDPGRARYFTVLAAERIAATGSLTTQGHLGVGAGKIIEGISPSMVPDGIHFNDTEVESALNDAMQFSTELSSAECGVIQRVSIIRDAAFTPGHYCFVSAARLFGVVTLDARHDASASWIFVIPAGFYMDTSTEIRLVNGARAANVFWIVNGSVEIGSRANFSGNIIARSSIVCGEGSRIEGRVISLAGSILLNANTIVFPVPAGDELDRELYDDPVRFDQLSSGGRTRLELKFGPRADVPELPGDQKRFNKKGGGEITSGGGEEVPMSAGTGQGSAPLSTLANPLVNDPTADATAQDTQSETTIILGAGSNVLAGFNDSGSYIGALHFTGYSRSIDGGTTWVDQGTLPVSPNGDVGDPVMARDVVSGRSYFSTLFFTGSGIQVFRSDNDGATWMAPVNGSPGRSGFQDKEWIAVDNFPGPGQGNVYLGVRDFGPGNGIFFHRSIDQGATWTSPGLLLASGSPFNVQGVYPVVGADHSVNVFYFRQSSPQQILMMKSVDQGITFGPPITVVNLSTTGTNGNLGLGFRSNAFPQVAVNPVNGHFYLVFNDNPPGVDRCNPYFMMSMDGGLTWSVPQQLNTDLTTNDNWQPAIAVTPDGTRLGIGWYDRRRDPANTMIEWWGVIGSISGGTVTFGPNFLISNSSFPPVYGVDPVVNSVYMGDYDVMTADNSGFYSVWGDNRDQSIAVPTRKNANIRFAKIPAAGPGPVLSYVSTSVSGGNANGKIDYNECNSLTITIENLGSATASGITATLSTTTPNVSVFQPNSGYPNLVPAANGTNTVLFELNTTPAFVCGTPIDLTLSLNYSGGSDILTFTIPSNSPTAYTVTTGSGALYVPGTTDIGNHCDDCNTLISLPFPFTFYDLTSTTANVTSNGFLQFVSSSSPYSNLCLPASNVNYAILPHWDDLRTDQFGQGIFTSISGSAPNRVFNIEWRTSQLGNTNPIYFEVRLYETSNEIEFVYLIVNNNGGSATVGIQQGTGVAYTQYSCNSNTLYYGFSVKFTPPSCPDGGGQCGAVCNITCPADITVNNAPNQCGANVSYAAPTTAGPCGTVTCTPASGSFFPVGTTTVTCNTTAGPSCDFTVTVNDVQPPAIICPTPVAVESDATCNGANVSLPVPTISDNCPGAYLFSMVPPSGSYFPIGTTTVTATARDAAGNSASCTFPVTVESRVKIDVAANPIAFAFSCKSNVSYTKMLRIDNIGGHFGGGVMNWTASTTASEITLSPSSGVEGGSLGIIVNPAGLGYGTYNRTITITAWNSITNAPACNSPYTLNIVITVQPSVPVTQTKPVDGSFTTFTNSAGQPIADIRSNVGYVSSFTVNCVPCTYPNGMTRLRYIKRYYTFSTSAANRNFDIRLYYTNSEVYGNTDEILLTIWQQRYPGGTWINRGGTSDIWNNHVTATGVLNLDGVFAMAHRWTPKFLTLSLLSAVFDRPTRQAVIRWNSNLETNENGFIIERTLQPGGEEWGAVGDLPYRPSGEYTFRETLTEDGDYYYRLAAMDEEGNWYETEPFLLTAGSAPIEYALEQNYPNPFNPSTTIRYQIAEPGMVTLKVYDIYWREVATLVQSEQVAGRYQVAFDASTLPSGVYYYRIESGQYTRVRKMNLMK